MGGAAKNTEIIFRELSERSVVPVIPVVTSAGGLAHNRSVGYHIRRIAKNIRAALVLLRHTRARSVVYVVPDGGYGAWYTLAHLCLCRLLLAQVVIHHRTFRYIDSESLPVRLFTKATRKSAVHVFLSDGMGQRYMDRYGRLEHLVATNARFVRTSYDSVRHGAPSGVVLGHLSNLCRDKGFFEVVDTFEALLAEGFECRLRLGGPILEPEVAARLALIQEVYHDRVVYVGPVDGNQKASFYQGVDIFLFPTQFDLEAQPNVVYEAFSFGIPVITIDRGCIREMVPEYAGLVVNRTDDFPRAAARYVAEGTWKDSNISRKIMAFVEEEGAKAREAYKRLYRHILRLQQDA